MNFRNHFLSFSDVSGSDSTNVARNETLTGWCMESPNGVGGRRSYDELARRGTVIGAMVLKYRGSSTTSPYIVRNVGGWSSTPARRRFVLHELRELRELSMTPHDLVELGFAVTAIATPRLDGGCTCRLGAACPSSGKHPTSARWIERALARRDNPREMAMFLRSHPPLSYGLIPVPGSNLIVIDRDDPNVGLPMPPTFECHRANADPRRGHYYFRLNGVAEADVPRAFSGGEVRVAASGHVVGMGSRHSSGVLYEGNDQDVANADSDLIDALRALRPVRRDTDGHVEAVEGSRHAYLVNQARKFAGWGWDADRIEEQLVVLNETVVVPPLDDGEFSRMAEWAVKNIARDIQPVVRIGGKR